MRRGVSSGILLLLLSASQLFAADQPPACKLHPVKLANPDSYRPSGEVHSGRVIVEFTIPESGAKPVDLVVAESSSYPALDAAALRVIEDSRFKTSCPGTRTKLAVKFNPPH